MTERAPVRRIMILAVAVSATAVAQSGAQEPPTERYRDREDAVPTSIFGTYVRPGEFLVYPFFEYYRDGNFEYEPGELGSEGATEFRGRYRASEGLIFVAYGLTDRVAFELEAATIAASLEKSPLDTSSLPARIEESGLGDVETQLRWRWRKESDARPELFSYFETVFPTGGSRVLIGEPDWEFTFGTGVIRGLKWGTVTVRAAVTNSGGSFEAGEYAFEYLRRLSKRLRVFAAIEGSEDEVELISEAQVFLHPRVVLKLNNAFGVTSKATDWAPEIGVLFSFP
jgi:hypothetical protein